MTDFLIPFLFVMIPFTIVLIYWASHDPSSIRSLSAFLLDQVHTLNAWAKAQEARKRVYGKAIAKHRLPISTTRRHVSTKEVPA